MQRLFPAIIIAFLLLSGTVWAAPTDADKAFAIGKRFYDLRLDARAVTELQKFITTYPKDARLHQARFMLGRTLQYQGKYPEALAVYSQLIATATGPELKTLRADVHFQCGECYVSLKQYDKAVTSYTNSLKLIGDDVDLKARANYWLAESLYSLQRYPDAMRAYAEVAKVAPEHALAPWAIYSQGMIDLRQGRHDAAIVNLERVLTYTESEVVGEASLMLGYAYSGRAQANANPEAAQLDYRKAIEIFNGVLNNDKATASAKQHAASAQAECYFFLREYAQAETAYSKALQGIDPKSPPAAEMQLRRGHTLYNSGRFREAAQAYTQVAGTNVPGLSDQALYWLGSSWYEVGKLDKNAQAYSDAITAFRRYRTRVNDKAADAPRAALYIAFSLEDLAALGDATARSRALLAFQDVRDKWPTAREAEHARDGLARMTAIMAPQELLTVVNALSADAKWSVDLTVARKEFRDKQYDNALTAAKKVLDGNPTNDVKVQAAYIIGACLQQTVRAADAIKYYRQALEADPAGELSTYILRGLVVAYLDTRQPAPARDAALDLLKHDLTPLETAQTLLNLGNAYTANRDFDSAQTAYARIGKEFADAAPDLVPLAYMGLAGVAEARRDATEAVNRYREVVRLFPDHEVAGQAFYRIGVNLSDLKQYAEAIEAFNNVPKISRMADRAAYAAAWAYMDQDKTAEANAQFVRVAEQFDASPLAADSLAQVGEYYMGQKQYEKGADFFGRALDAVKPGSATPPALIAYKQGVCAYYAKLYDVAAAAFDRVVDDYPTSEYAADSLFMKGRAFDLQEQPVPARDAYLQYVAKYPNQSYFLDAALGAGRTAITLKQYAAARADLAKAQTSYVEMRAKSGVLPERARGLMAEVQFYLAESYYQEMNFSEAFKQYAAVPDNIEPWSSRALLQMARAAIQLRNLEDARDVLSSLLTKYPGSEAALQAPKVARDNGIELK